MAIGDKAAAHGLATWPDSQDHKYGAGNDNQRGDELADEIDARTAADLLKLDASRVIVQAATPANIPGAGYSGRIWIKKA